MLTFSMVTLVDKSRDDMTIFNVEIIIRTKYITGNDTSEHAAILLMVSSRNKMLS